MLGSISWLDILVHHLDAAAPHQAKVVVFGRRTASASPAKLILAVRAGHMVATLVFLNAAFADWALRHILLVLLGPLA